MWIVVAIDVSQLLVDVRRRIWRRCIRRKKKKERKKKNLINEAGGVSNLKSQTLSMTLVL
jgi:hypothetical protein